MYKVEKISGFSCPKKYLLIVGGKPFLFFNTEMEANKAISVLSGFDTASKSEGFDKFIKNKYANWKGEINLKLKSVLENKYGCKFKIINTNVCFEVIYNDENLRERDGFLDEVIDIASEYLEKDEFDHLSISYDYLNEIGDNI